MYRVLSFWDRVCIEIHDTRRFRVSCSELWPICTDQEGTGKKKAQAL